MGTILGKETKTSKVVALAMRLAGDKWEKVSAHANHAVATYGVQPERALADALEIFNCL